VIDKDLGSDADQAEATHKLGASAEYRTEPSPSVPVVAIRKVANPIAAAAMTIFTFTKANVTPTAIAS
jgi:hypothetical protein